LPHATTSKHAAVTSLLAIRIADTLPNSHPAPVPGEPQLARAARDNNMGVRSRKRVVPSC
jgi:hypothetical protein